MITVRRNGTSLEVLLEHGLSPQEPRATLLLAWNAGTEILAEALVRQVAALVRDRVHDVREKEYASGWKDAKAKKGARRTWFRSGLEDVAP